MFSKSTVCVLLLLTLLNAALLFSSWYLYLMYRSRPSLAASMVIHTESINSNPIGISAESSLDISEVPCDDEMWCNVKMPSVSYFRFDPPTDPIRWKAAQLQASRGDQILLQHVVKVFPNHYDFLDGDISFRKLHYIFDVFVDEYRDLTPLVPPHLRVDTSHSAKPFAKKRSKHHNSRRLKKKGGSIYEWENEGKSVVPLPYDFRSTNRSAIVSIGYTAYQRDSQTYFSGNRLGGAFIDRSKFFKHWARVKNSIDIPFISICTLNENWGMLSTTFPNRTAKWGRCCDSNEKDKVVFEFLDHPKTLMLVTNQHTNVSHPKLIIMPRGIPSTWGSTRVIIWDAMRSVLRYHRKDTLLFAAASTWGPRPQILQCVSDKVSPRHFDGHSSNPRSSKLSREEYYVKLGSSMFGLGLPGLGYDCFRVWELMTMGSIVILERGVGLDRTVHRLPALMVEDFDDITEELLRVAYVEALYRASDFDFRRLTQSFWYSVISNVSSTMSVQTILDYFPMYAEEPNFGRPREPYECGKSGTCGRGTRRIPKNSC